MPLSSQACAREVLEAVPLVMRAIRAEMRRHRAAELSVPQFRSLTYLRRNAGASLSDVAEHIGLALPSMSKLIDGLVERGLVRRGGHSTDRRRITLSLTPRGRGVLLSAHRATQEALAAALNDLSEEERAMVVGAMRALGQRFGRPQAGRAMKGAD